MLLRNLTYLDALAREEHFARAAAVCHVTQPTLSSGIKQLEEELGLLIVQRGQRFQGFTPEGKRVLQWARRILSDATSLQQEASELREGLEGRLRIGVIPVALPAMALLSTPFAQYHPRVIISILSMTSIDIQRGLDEFSLDAGVTYLDNEPLTDVRTLPLYRERYYLIAPTDRAPHGKAPLPWSAIGEQELCLLTPDMQNRRIINTKFAQVGINPRVSLETNSVLTLWAQVRSGALSTLLPQPFPYLMGESEGIRAIALEEAPPHFTLGLAVPDREPLTPSARELFKLAANLELEEALNSRPGRTVKVR
ncbi:MAG TPA: LysR substrate-binding domain-containing protein [Gemmatimonadales bacterium]|nr:LysR substrate-binding domain-containing protein [Gemmatimonadales bacterium]